MDTLAEAERDKYARMWAVPDYRKKSPGERAVPDAVMRLGIQPGDTVRDYGCGTGRASVALAAHGCNVSAVDITAAALPAGFHGDIEFTEAPLWSLDLPVVDWAFCCDVLEHIPQERLSSSMVALLQARKGAYFTVCHQPDSFGKRIGETLHLTVKPVEWWLDRYRSMIEGLGFTLAVTYDPPTSTWVLTRKE